MKFIRIIKYFWAGRFLRDLRSIFFARLDASPEIIFFAGSQIDLKWILPIYRLGVDSGIRCVIAGPSLILPPYYTYIDVTAHALKFLRTKIMATATTGLTPQKMPRASFRNVAIPHSLLSFHMVYPSGTFDGYTDVFCSGIHHYNEIIKMNHLDGISNRRPILIGYEDGILYGAQEKGNSTIRKCHVLLGPSWAPGNILETIGEELIEALLASGYHVTLRPHPSFFTIGHSEIERILDRFGDDKSFELESSTQESRALWTADVLISDYSGFALEYAFIRVRPVLYVDVLPKELNPAWRDIELEPIELFSRRSLGLLVAPKINEIVNGVSILVASPERWTAEIERVRMQHWVNFGSYAQAAIFELQAMLNEIDGDNQEVH